MYVKGLTAPRNIKIDFKPSPRQYELWKLLQPNYCPKCGGTIGQKQIGSDTNGKPLFKPVCSQCGNDALPQLILGGGAAGGGKAQPLDSVVMTPRGYRRIGSLSVGDTITSATTGLTQKITYLHPIQKRPYYRVTFEDGESVLCSDGHLWDCFMPGEESRTIGVRRMKRLIEAGIPLYIPVQPVVRFNDDWKYDPGASYFCYGATVAVRGCRERLPADIKKSLRARTEFLNGFLSMCDESDGVAVFTTSNAPLARDVAYVARSLGAIAALTDTPDGTVVEIWNYGRFMKAGGIRIMSIEAAGEMVGRCISVSDQSGLYITGSFKVTHNSYIGCAWVAINCMRFPDIRAALARKTIKSLKESTFNTFISILNSWGLVEQVNYKINNLEGFLTFWNGSKVYLKELELLPKDPQFERLGSTELTIAFVDEVSEICEKAIETLMSRCRWKTGETFVYPRVFLSTNPCATWVRSRFVQDDDGNPVRLSPTDAFVRFTVFDNPDEKFVSIYRRNLELIRDPAVKARLLYGNWDFPDANDSAAYWSFRGEDHLVTSLSEQAYNPLLPVILSFDFNVAPYMSCLVIQVDYPNKTVNILEEILGRPEDKENNTPRFASKINNKLLALQHLGGIMITGDPAGTARSTQTVEGVNNYTIISSAMHQSLRPQVRLLPKQPPQKTRLEFVNGILEGDNGWTLRADMRCRRFTEDMIFQKKNADGTKEKKKVVDPKLGIKYEKYGHLSDCLDYALCLLLNDEWRKFQKVGNGGIATVQAPIYGNFSY